MVLLIEGIFLYLAFNYHRFEFRRHVCNILVYMGIITVYYMVALIFARPYTHGWNDEECEKEDVTKECTEITNNTAGIQSVIYYSRCLILHLAILIFKLNSDIFADFSKLDGIAKIS